MKRFILLTTTLLCLCVTQVRAYDFVVGGIYYNKLTTNTVAVTYKEENIQSYSGSITIPSTVAYNGVTYSVTSIGSRAFWGCSGLTSVTIPNSVTSIGSRAFWGCSGLTSMKVASGNPVYDSRDNCNAIIETATNTLISGCKSTVIPNSVTSIGNDAFSACSGLTSVTIPNSVTSIRSYAFSGCSSLTSVTIPNSVTSIGSGAFSGCSGLTSVRISALEAWCNIAFSTSEANPLSFAHHLILNGTEVSNLVIPSSLNTIKANTFSGCSDLTSVNIPNSVTSIGSAAFSGCSGLTYVTIPNSVTSIGSAAFSGCSGLTYVTIPSSVTSIGNWAFGNCSSLTSVVAEMETPVSNIPYYAGYGTYFEGFFNNIGSSCVLTVPYGTRDAYIAAGWTEDVFKGGIIEAPAQNIDFADALVKAICVGHWDTNGDGELSEAEAAAVTNIGESIFSGNTNITSFDELRFFTGLTAIGANAFLDCANLRSVILPDNLQAINNGAFARTALSAIDIPSNVTVIESDAFLDCASLTYASLPQSLQTIGNGAFARTGLTSIKLPAGLTSIGEMAFQDCSNLTNVVSLLQSPFRLNSDSFARISNNCVLRIPAGTYNNYYSAGWIGYFKSGVFELTGSDSSSKIVFADARVKALCVANWDTNGDGELSEAEAEVVTSLGAVFKNMIIQSFDELQYFTGLTSIEYEAFRGCRNLVSVTIPDQVTSLGGGAFYDCTSLASITIPASVTSIGDYAFSGLNAWESLTSIVVEDGNPVYDSRNNCNAIIETSSNKLIVGCANTVIPSDVTSIENGAFEFRTGLTSITLPAGLNSIGDFAFKNCTGLSSIEFPNGLTKIGKEAFLGCIGLTSVTIPGSVTNFGERAFESCGGLTSIDVSSCESNVGAYAFYECNNLKRINNWTTTSTDKFHFNSWSTEQDGSGITIPFIELWCGAGNMLNDATITHNPITGLTPGIYTATILVRFYNEANYATYPSGITFFANNASVKLSDVCMRSVYNSEFVGQSALLYGELSLDCTVGQDGVLNLGFQIEDAVGDWLAFKNLDFELKVKNIVFADANVKALCVANWDTNGDGELSEAEAAAVTDLGEVFKGNTTIQSFDELQYFTGLTRIRWEAFAACTSLTSVIIPNSVTVLGDRAFSGSALEDVALPSSVTEIRQGAFMNCGKLKSINVPEGVQVITLSSFQNTPALKSITLPDGITSIEHHAFTMSGIEAINLPEGLTSIGECAFQACNSLGSVVSLVQSPATIVKNVFMDISPDCVLTIPEATCYEDYVAKGWTPELFARIEPSYIIFADNAVKAICLQNWDADHDGMLTFAEAAAVTDLGNVFAGNTQIVTFNELKYFTGLSTLSADAFRGCSALTSITVPADLPSYGTLSFKGCTSLAEINIGTDRNVHNLGFVNKAQGWSDEGTVDCFCSEFWNKAFDTHQTLLVPNGSYRMKFKAFQRPADYTTAYNDYAAGNWDSFAVVYANDTEKALKHICDGMQEQRLDGSDVAVGNSYIPKTMWGARVYFDAGLYADELEVEVTDGTLTFGVRGDYKQYSQWAIFSDFELSLKKVLATGIALNSESVTMTGTGETYSLYATVSPTDVTEKSVTWTSSDESVATVSNGGVVTAVANGTAIITATTNDGSNLSATCTVTNEIIPMSEWTKENTFNYNIQLVKANQNDHTYTETCQVDLEQVRSAVGEGKIKLYTRKDDSDSPYTRGYTCTPYPGFWMDEQGEYPVEYSSTTSYGMTFNETSGVITFYSKPWVDMVGNQYTSSFYLVNETNGKYVELNLNVSIIAEEPAVEPDTDISGLDNVIYIEAQSVYVGDEVTLDVKMKNTLIPVGCSFRLTLPSGFTLKRDEYDDVDYILGSRANKMSVNLSETSDASYNVALTPTSGTATIRGNEDTVVSFTLQVSDEAVAGTYPVRLTRSLIQSKVDGTTHDTSLSDVYVTFTVEDFLLGDVNGDGNITPSDAIMILYHYFEVGQNGFNVKAADVNGDGSITPADAIEVLYIYFNDSSGSKSRQTDFQELDPQ